jgi:hypothetical protein
VIDGLSRPVNPYKPADETLSRVSLAERAVDAMQGASIITTSGYYNAAVYYARTVANSV